MSTTSALERIGNWFKAKEEEVKEQLQAAASTYGELVDQLATIELTGDGEPPDAANVAIILDSAGKTVDQLKGDVSGLVASERSKQLAATASAKRQVMVAAIREMEELNARFIAEREALVAKYRPLQAELERKRVAAEQDAHAAQTALRDLDYNLQKSPRERELLAARDRLASEREELRLQHRHAGHRSDRFAAYSPTPELAATFEEEPEAVEDHKLLQELRSAGCTGSRAMRITRRRRELEPVLTEKKRAHGFKVRIDALDDQIAATERELAHLAADRIRPQYGDFSDIGEAIPSDDGELKEMESSKRRRQIAGRR